MSISARLSKPLAANQRALELLERPLLELVFEAAQVHRAHHDPGVIQCAQLLSIKTGGCPEDCGYCSQSALHATGLQRASLMETCDVVAAAQQAKGAGADRFCLGAAWREVKPGKDFDRVLDMVSEVKALGLEVCATLGMIDVANAERLKDAGLDFYNHNLDTSREHYERVISTRGYDERLDTLKTVRGSGMRVCSGGILGMGESVEDRAAFLTELSSLDPAPESIPIKRPRRRRRHAARRADPPPVGRSRACRRRRAHLDAAFCCTAVRWATGDE